MGVDPLRSGGHVVVVGAGFAGLSASLHLRGAGFDVTVIDDQQAPGGMCASEEIDGIHHDLGPTVLTMPELIRRGFSAVGAAMDDYVSLLEVPGRYRASYADGSVIESADPDGVRALCGETEGEHFAEYLAWCTRMYQAVFDRFIDSDVSSLRKLLGADLARLVRLGGFRSLGAVAAEFLPDERTRRLGTFQALYAGLAPAQARAMYGVISYMDLVSPVVFPRGGMAALPRAMGAAARDAGVNFLLDQRVERVVVRGQRVAGVVAEGGERHQADAAVLAVDRAREVPRLLGRAPMRRKLQFSPSALVLSMRVQLSDLPAAAHHSILFGAAWEETFDELIRHKVVPSDLSLLVSVPALTDPALAKDGRAAMYVLTPVPSGAGIDWSVHTSPLIDRILDRLRERGYPADRSSVMKVLDPNDWRDRGMPAGTPFSLAHTVRQTGPFRPRPDDPQVRNVVFAGAGTSPGVGVPTTIISGELAARRLVDRS